MQTALVIINGNRIFMLTIFFSAYHTLIVYFFNFNSQQQLKTAEIQLKKMAKYIQNYLGHILESKPQV